MIDGRSNLAKPLAQRGLGRDATYDVIAAGRCSHAGAGSWQGLTQGNSNFIVIEAENTGLPNDMPWRHAAAVLQPYSGNGSSPNRCAWASTLAACNTTGVSRRPSRPGVCMGTLAQRDPASRAAIGAGLVRTQGLRFLDLSLRDGPDHRALTDVVKVNACGLWW